MVSVIVRRLGFLVIVIVAITVLTFTLSHLTGVDPVRTLAGPHATAAQLATLRHRFGLDRPVPNQYLSYLNGLAHGDLGIAVHTHRTVANDLAQFLPPTIELVVAAMILAIVGGIVLGTFAAVYQDSWIDALSRLVSISGVALPVFWLGLLAQLLFYDSLGWLPAGGQLDTGATAPATVTGAVLIDSLLAGRPDLFLNSCWHLLLPATVLSYAVLGSITRMMRNSLLEILRQDYIRTARAKGLAQHVVVVRHAIRNAMLPTLTTIGLQFGALLGGTILVEVVFSWPGIGLYLYQSISSADYNPILGVTTVIAALYVLANLAVDLGYAALDPRIRYR
jgi:peptide/nickel transport system permease protein